MMVNNNLDGEFIGIDVGASRIGIARIHSQVGIAEPLTVLQASDDKVIEQILKIGESTSASGYVVGLPRGLDGQETAQTALCRDFARLLKAQTNTPVYVIDEAGTSVAAEERISQNGQGTVDSVAAAIFLEDFIAQKDKSIFEVTT